MERDAAKFLPKLLKKEIGWKYSRTARMEETWKNMSAFLYYLFTLTAARGGTCAFTLKIVNTLINTWQ